MCLLLKGIRFFLPLPGVLHGLALVEANTCPFVSVVDRYL